MNTKYKKAKLSAFQITLLFSLYITQYLGLAFFTEALIGILRQNGMPLENLGLVYMIGLFWVFRFLWAPFIDRYKFKKLGHYRGWIFIFQSLMALTLFNIALFNVIDDLMTIIILSFLFAFFASSQNIALDALIYKSVYKRERAKAFSIKTSSGLIGMVVGGGIGLVVYTYIGWYYTMLIITLLTISSMLLLLFFKEPKGKGSFVQEKVDFKQYIDFWRGKQKKKWLLLLFIYPVAISSAFGMITPILVDQGWGLDKIGYIVHILGYGIGVLASFSATWFIKRYGKRNVLVAAAIGQSIGMAMMLLLLNNNSDYLVMFVVGFVFAFYTPSAVIISTLMMDQVSKKAPAAQFAIQHSSFMFAGIFFTSISVSLSGVFGYANVIIACSLIGLIAAYMALNIETIIKKEVKEIDDRTFIVSPSA